MKKVAIVTGGSRGLGRNAVEQLASRGVNVLFTYHSRVDQAEEVVAEVERRGAKAVALRLDASDTSTFDGFVAQVQEILQLQFQQDRFHFLVNNAGTGVHAPFAQTSEAQFDAMMNVHLKGPFFLTQKLLPLLADGGRIVNLSTGLTRFVSPGMSAYASMKGAIEVLTRYMAKELGHRGIAVNVVAPGAIETDFGGGMVRDNKQVNQHVAANTALGRVGVPDDIGGMIALLLSDENRWINAQRIEVSGGMAL